MPVLKQESDPKARRQVYLTCQKSTLCQKAHITFWACKINLSPGFWVTFLF